MRVAVLDHLRALAADTSDLVSTLDDESLRGRIEPRSNTIGAQLWCVVGARESYVRAIEADGWAGFSCSLTAETAQRLDDVLSALEGSARLLTGLAKRTEWSAAQTELLLRLLEHEAQHQGQLIRYGYALGLSFPESWVERWALSG